MNYNTVDGIHWDEETTKMYVELMFDSVSDL